jgi:regulator of replication initiation timing
MLTPLKNLEQKLELLIAAVKQTRNENLALRQDNYTLHVQNQQLLERMSQAQERLDLLLHSLEQRVDAPPSEGNN